MPSSDSEGSSKDHATLDQANVTDISSRQNVRFKSLRLLFLGIYSVVGVFLYYSGLANFLANYQVRREDNVPTSKVQDFVRFRVNTLGHRIKGILTTGPEKYSGLYNSFHEGKKAYSMKVKVALNENDLQSKNIDLAQVLEFGETQFRNNLLQPYNFWVEFRNSKDYAKNRLGTKELILRVKYLFFKYPAIREPPGSLKFDQGDSHVIEYIYEYIAINPRILYEQLINDQINVPTEQLQQIDNWSQNHNGVRQFGSLNLNPKKEVLDYELIEILNNGPPKNRIDIVFMGDGYTKEERGKFVDDITRLSKELFEEGTFKTWLPLINVWAAFVPSEDSGIGTDGKPSDTPFGLYRDSSELRGIYCSKPDSVRAICNRLGYALCDFPIIIANDDYFGGLSGEYIISTRSVLSSSVVLRHEMGHTFNRVGEEHDGGLDYGGINTTPGLFAIPWEPWLPSKLKVDENGKETPEMVWDFFKDKDIKEEKSTLAILDNSWHDLSKNGPYVLHFDSTGEYSRWYIKISTSGMSTEGSFKAYLDGVEIPWKAPGTLDRTFYTWFNGTHGLSKGSHQLRFEAGPGLPEGKIIRQLCNVEMLEYASEEEFHWDDPQRIGAYPTYDYKRRKTYRPTNEYCLMRNLTSIHFCPVCNEGLWLKFLDRVSLVDEFDIKRVRLPKSQVRSDAPIPHPEPTDYVVVTKDSPNHHFVNSKNHPEFTMGYLIDTKLLRLDPKYLDGHQKELGDSPSKQGYILNWSHNDHIIKELFGVTSFIVPDISPYIVGLWDLRVLFKTPQVKTDENYIMSKRGTFILRQPI